MVKQRLPNIDCIPSTICIQIVYIKYKVSKELDFPWCLLEIINCFLCGPTASVPTSYKLHKTGYMLLHSYRIHSAQGWYPAMKIRLQVDKILSIILIAAILGAIGILGYMITTPQVKI